MTQEYTITEAGLDLIEDIIDRSENAKNHIDDRALVYIELVTIRDKAKWMYNEIRRIL